MNSDSDRTKELADSESEPQDRRESGVPGGGQGRRDEVGPSGVYRPDAADIPPDAEVRMAGSWGGGDYYESGGSDLIYHDGELLGGTTAGPRGEPTIDIHGGGQGLDSPFQSAEGGSSEEIKDGEVVDRDTLRLRGLPAGDDRERIEEEPERS